MSTLKTNNIEHLDASSPSIQLDVGGGMVVAGVITATSMDLTSSDGFTVGTGASVSSPETNVLTLGTNNTERLRITSGGDINVAAGSSVFIANGNLVFSTSGTGIDFSAASGSAAGSSSAVLDDYEEGTFTPSFLNVAAPTYSNQSGSYVKIGNLVNYTLDINYSSLDTGDASAMAIGGLPFLSATTAAGTVAGGGNVTGGVTINFYSGSATTGVCVQISANVNSLSLLGLGDSNTFDYSNCNATGRIRVTGCYISA